MDFRIDDLILFPLICTNPGSVSRFIHFFLSCIIREKFITKMDLVNSAAFYSKNVFNVLTVHLRSFFYVCLCIINHLHHLIKKSSEYYPAYFMSILFR